VTDGRSPPGEAGPHPHPAELFDLSDPDEAKNVASDPKHEGLIRELRAEVDRLLRETGASPDPMPLDEGIKQALPDAKIR
jgi:N-acetylglucosamine-6-sulfatase